MILTHRILIQLQETNPSSTYIDFIITVDYETDIVVDTILKTDHSATITVLKSVYPKSKTIKQKLFDKKTIQPYHSRMFLKFRLETLLRCGDGSYNFIRI